MMKEDLHLEVTIRGVSKDIFADVMSWLWQAVQPLFPIITGEWSLVSTALIAAPIVVLLMLCNGFRDLAAAGRTEVEMSAAGAGTGAVLTKEKTVYGARSQAGMAPQPPWTVGALAPHVPAAASAAITRSAPVVVPLVCRPLRFVCRMA